ncbi:GAF domain-containing sensor histidine kinase [Candidatus Daviesbacteria bacterium]|nr:GAF domain-containing sensor histidine kinase [Candidatus Daviesbacteria bacterium]
MDNVLEKIYRSGLKFLVPLTPEETYKLIVDEAIKLVRGEVGSISLKQDGELHRVYTSSPAAYNHFAKTSLSQSEDEGEEWLKLPRQMKRSGLSLKHKNSADFQSAEAYKIKPVPLNFNQISKVHPEVKNTMIYSDMIVTLSYRNKSIGVLTVMSTKRNQFSQKELNILKLFGPLASLAIRKTQLYDETRRALETRDLFISMAAHELRTPLTSVNGYIQLLYSKLSGGQSVESRWVEQLSWEILRLTNLVNELLEINRIKKRQLEYHWKESSLLSIIKRVILNLKFAHPNRRIEFINLLENSLDVVIGDFDKLLQAFTNLLENAIKFSPPDKEVEVNLSSKKNYFYIVIKDQGKGIFKEDIPKVLEGFYKGLQNYREGMGIGLFLAKNIINSHHGDINIFSKPNRGTIVKVKLPKPKFNSRKNSN